MSKHQQIAKLERFNWLERELPKADDQREYALERCIVALTEAVASRMREAGLSRTKVAAKIGVTKGHVSQVLSGRRNMTLRSLADLLWACGAEVKDLQLAPLGVSMVPEQMLCDTHVATVESEVDGDREAGPGKVELMSDAVRGVA